MSNIFSVAYMYPRTRFIPGKRPGTGEQSENVLLVPRAFPSQFFPSPPPPPPRPGQASDDPNGIHTVWPMFQVIAVEFTVWANRISVLFPLAFNLSEFGLMQILVLIAKGII